MEEATDGLRKAAPDWTLAGDQRLLDLLQEMHQKILEKCQETNKQLDNMVTALDDASINLQNVNNKLTALSNNQFIESRVYDDDFTEAMVPEPPKEQPTPIPASELDNATESLLALERMHETITILCDSGTDSGTDGEGGSVVVKPKDLYASRPLPYIIGSQQWKNKWHAGLIREDSELESADESENEDREQYSESGSASERGSPAMSSYSLDSHKQYPEPARADPAPAPVPVAAERPMTQADIAAELARRLGASAKAPAVEADLEPQPAVRKLYAPHRPAPGNVFSDEPPPLENDQSEESDHDIFAEIYKTSSNSRSNKDKIGVADDLFGKPIFDDQVPSTNAFQKPVVDKELSKSNENTPTEQQSVGIEDVRTKKPVGGKSIFGSNANSESIGAAILKRKSRHSSSSGEESDQEPAPVAKPIQTIVHKNNDNVSTKVHGESQNKKERDIFDELFAKSERVNKELDNKQKKEDRERVIKTPEKIVKKVDLFSDNIFDDIFTSSVSKNAKENPVKEKAPTKSIFDEDDDLFSDLAVNKKPAKDIDAKDKGSKSTVPATKVDLFNSKQKETPVSLENKNIAGDKPISNVIKESKGLFEDSDDDLFSDFNKPKNTQPEQLKTKIKTDDLFSDDDNLFLNKTTGIKKVTPKLIINVDERKESGDMKTKKFVQSPDLFDDDILSDTMSPKNDTKTDIDKETFLPNVSHSNTKHNEHARTSVNIMKQDIEVKPPQESLKTDKDTKALEKESVLRKTEREEYVFDDDSNDDLFGKPLKVNPVVSKDRTLRESHITKDKSDNTLEDVKDTADKPEVSKRTDDTKDSISKVVVDESKTVADSNTVLNTEVIISENISGNVTLSKPEISVKPTVQALNSRTEVSQIQSINKTDIEDQKDTSPDIFADEAKYSFPSISEPMPESKTDAHQDLFTDIFNDQPPEFEKPKEPKKSKNVNALFDDDSDDESLFFKKNDVVVDDGPEGFTTKDDRLFGLFRDEPPAIDVDFVQKPNKKDNVDSFTTKSEGKKSNIINNNIFDDDADLFAAKIDSDKPCQEDIKFNESDDFENSFSYGISAKENLKTSEIKNLFAADAAESKTQDTLDSPQESKKIGKLKPMSFNINVNTLLPGASAKKTIKKDVKDNNDCNVQTLDQGFELPTEEGDIPDNTETNMVKSVSFEGEPDSAVLNNKLSKERAKIQVKRRPSTRRARKEAVKKSGIDFGEDSTDNSASVDDSKSEKTDDTDTKTETSQNEDKDNMNKQELVAQNAIDKQTTSNTENAIENSLDRGMEKEDSRSEIYYLPDDTTIGLVRDIPDSITSVAEVATNVSENVTDSKIKYDQENQIKSKVVYVLNDDDIFNTSSKNNNPNDLKKSIFDDFNDEDDIFKTMSAPKEVKYAAKDTEKTKSGATKSHEPLGKTEIFANDSDSDDLFKKVSRPTATNIEKPKTEKLSTTKSDQFEDPSKSFLISGSSQTTNIISKTVECEKSEDLPKKIAKPVTVAAKADKILLSDSDDEALFKKIPASTLTKTKEAHIKNSPKTDNPKDISSTTKIEHKPTARTLSNDEDEDLFKSIPISVSTNQDSKAKKKTSVFDTDEDLFKTSTKNVQIETKVSIFDSDSDDELFSGKKKGKSQPRKEKDVFEKKKKEVKKVDKKISLFGDESDGDDLFGAKKKTSGPKPRISSTRDAPKDTSSVKPKPVLEDPLSLFGDED